MQESLERLQAEMRACRRCVEAGHIQSAQPIFSGRASDRLMVVGQAPGPVSEQRGIPFAGPAGRVLKEWLVRAGFPEGYFREATYLTSLTRCFPGKSPHGEGDRPPSRAERALCHPYLEAELELVRPEVMLLVGKLAIEEFLGKSRLEDVVGTAVERDGVLFIPLPHSSGVSRWLNTPEHQALVDRALALLSEARIRLGL
jgi:uracil-DNA glycosylase